MAENLDALSTDPERGREGAAFELAHEALRVVVAETLYDLGAKPELRDQTPEVIALAAYRALREIADAATVGRMAQGVGAARVEIPKTRQPYRVNVVGGMWR